MDGYFYNKNGYRKPENSDHENLYYNSNYFFVVDKEETSRTYKFNVKCTSLKDVSLVRDFNLKFQV